MHPKLAPTEEKRGGTMNTWVGSTIVVLCVCSESQLSVERFPSRANNSTKKAKMAHRFLVSPKPSALVAGWLGSDTKLDYADTNSPDRS